jgi:hypothetical protein
MSADTVVVSGPSAPHSEGHEYVVCPECASEILLEERGEYIDRAYWGDEIDDAASGEDVDAEAIVLGFTCDAWSCEADFDATVRPPRQLRERLRGYP